MTDPMQKNPPTDADESSLGEIHYDFAALCAEEPTDHIPPPHGTPVVVSGLPRSGTSMLMQILHSGGISLLTDNHRPSDGNNPLGYFEFAPVKSSASNTDWFPQAFGKAVKVVLPLLRYLPPETPIDLLVIHRPLNEVVASQDAMLSRLGKSSSSDSRTTTALFANLMQNLPDFLRRRYPWRVLHIAYHKMLSSPLLECDRISSFLGRDFEARQAAGAVDPAQQTVHK